MSDNDLQLVDDVVGLMRPAVDVDVDAIEPADLEIEQRSIPANRHRCRRLRLDQPRAERQQVDVALQQIVAGHRVGAMTDDADVFDRRTVGGTDPGGSANRQA